MSEPFTENIIKHFLEEKLYEKRGISREEYIVRCKKIWEDTKCQDDEYKIISDGLYEYSNYENTNDYDDKLVLTHLKNKKKEDKIECSCLALMKWENGDLVKVSKDDKSSRNLDDPLEPEERPYLFALFDVLGFEALHTDIGTTNLYKTYQQLLDKVTSKDSYSTFQTFNDPKMALTMLGSVPLRYHYFSDTIILWTPFLPEFISPFCARCADVICESILMGLPLRGAISSGSAILNKNKGVFLGSPIIEAARVESQQNWVGVSFCPSSTEPHFQLTLHPDLLIQNYTEHYKSSNEFNKYVSLMTLDWAKRAREKNLDKEIIQQLISLKSKAPIDKQKYYEQTLLFMQHSLDNNEWYKNYELVMPKPLETEIKITLINGDELKGVLPNFGFKDRKYFEQYFLLIPKENIESVKNLSFEKKSFSIETLSKYMYLIPKSAIARQQLFRVEKTKLPDKKKIKETIENISQTDNSKSLNIGVTKEQLLNKIPKDLTSFNDTISRIFIGAKGYEIFLPTLNTIHECARNLIFANYAIPEGETWKEDGMEILYKIELFAHRDFINVVDNFHKQVDLSQETKDFFKECIDNYKQTCSTFIGDINGLLTNYDPHFKINFVPSIMQQERFRLLGQMTKILCNLTQTKEK